MAGKIFQINAKPRVYRERGLPKLSIESTIVLYEGLYGDFNRYRHEKKNDDKDKALLIMPLETINQLNEEGWPVKPGDLGENITSLGIPYSNFVPGNRYKVGGAEIQISEPCKPCVNLYLLPYVGNEKGPRFLKTLKDRRGWYAKVLQKGLIKREDSIEELIL